ncbi:molybdenum cofactor sulfurylase [Loktanella fryxellensis]|uniref:Molybdenum cofactor sulfurylase n=1 Tax=Loktanella fryxellensis TaxID=245187 RepID=A0A1H8D5E5_9RHOB|nr:xanthine dehydrogenase accessory protein XdhC [Loktanella fryxellensis]SEN02561.1 molybdenum cofactor sulfurylase [Loktanella fryxellensis]
MTGIRVSVTRTAGSVPREAGTQMMVWADRTSGTIGGGALEWEAMTRARAMLAEDVTEATLTLPLGPALGQCCGGSVTLRLERADRLDDAPGAPLWIWGAGHVGRALVGVMAPLPAYDVMWIDTHADRFPDDPGVPVLAAEDPLRAVALAAPDAHHLIVTYSHTLDLDLCHALLSRDFASVGLIGSATKWARFRTRLGHLGHSPAQIARIRCPIGDPTLGKHPQAIAIGVAMGMLRGGMADTGEDADD